MTVGSQLRLWGARLRDGMREDEFVRAVDASLPDDPAALELVVTLACTISDNAAVMVVYELASERPERSFVGRRIGLLERVAKERATPVVEASVAVACALLRDDVVPFDVVRRLDGLCRALDRATPRNALALLDMAREFAR